MESGCYTLEDGREMDFAQFRYLYQYLCLHNQPLNDTRWRNGPCSEDNPGNEDLFLLLLTRSFSLCIPVPVPLTQPLYPSTSTSMFASTSASTSVSTTSRSTTHAGGTVPARKTTQVRVVCSDVDEAVSQPLCLCQYVCHCL